MHDQPPWINKLLFPSAIKSQRTEPPMTDRLVALTKRIAELHHAGLEACHCVEEFFIRLIHPLDRRKTLHSNAREWPILTANLQMVVSLFFLHIIDNNLALI
jgi:hypothetical protein